MIDLSGVVVENDLLAPGEYVVSVDDAQIKETKDGTGEYINVKLKVMEGERKGKTLFTMFNLKNKNPEAVRIGHQQLKSFMQAAGFESFVIKNVSELCGARALAMVKQKTDDYGDKNVVSYYKKVGPSTAAANPVFTSDDIPF